MKAEIGISLCATALFWIVKVTTPWFTTDEDRQEMTIRIAARVLKLLALCFLAWAVVILLSLSGDMSRLELIFVSLYGTLQIGFAIFLYSFPYILERGLLSGIADALGDAFNRN